MANAQSIILHQFDRSPYSEKIRLALRMKNLGWAAVEIPSIMPKPDLTPLTGGYRRTPVMQIGADIFCDTSIMLAELEKRFQIPALTLPGHEGLASMVSAWTDGKWFQTSVAVIFGTIGEHMPQDFIDDRTKMSGRAFDVEAMKAAVPFMQDQWRSQLMWIEDRLEGGRRAGTGDWLVGTKPGMVDVHAFMNPWFVEQNVPDFLNECFESTPLTRDWYRRLKDFKGQAPEEISGAEAIEIAHNAAPRLKPASTAGDLRDLEPGDRVAIAPDDYAKDWVEGDLVIANSERVIIARQDERADNLHVHFPRVGYILRKA
ncbi:MAG: glutathione S-transferase N-terminal domain-containing protein [Pseudomonadota bacterium]|jgi:glutathione S-transferase|nr:glutathione S-transferase N-terminal domain-containing protein [Pseudomonadota bacterium]